MDQLTGDSRREDGEGEAYSGRDEGQRGAGRHGRAERGAGDLEEWETWGSGGGGPEAEAVRFDDRDGRTGREEETQSCGPCCVGG
jgi:hypothetical protein